MPLQLRDRGHVTRRRALGARERLGEAGWGSRCAHAHSEIMHEARDEDGLGGARAQVVKDAAGHRVDLAQDPRKRVEVDLAVDERLEQRERARVVSHTLKSDASAAADPP